jgi:uncharacterized protein (DUF1778 family)
MIEEETFRKQQERFQQFLKCLDGLSKNVAKLTEAVQKQTEMTALLYDSITRKEEGLISALDDTIESNEELTAQIDALRQDFPKFLRGLQTAPLYRRPGT